MQVLNNMFETNNIVGFEIKPNDFKHFLRQVKSYGFKWVDQSIINPDCDLAERNITAFIGVCKNKTIGFIPFLQWTKDKNLVKMQFEN